MAIERSAVSAAALAAIWVTFMGVTSGCAPCVETGPTISQGIYGSTDGGAGDACRSGNEALVTLHASESLITTEDEAREAKRSPILLEIEVHGFFERELEQGLYFACVRLDALGDGSSCVAFEIGTGARVQMNIGTGESVGVVATMDGDANHLPTFTL